jgi:hypothetical protein
LATNIQTLREALAEWQDADVAMFCLAGAIGLLDDSTTWGGRKDISWSTNPVDRNSTFSPSMISYSGSSSLFQFRCATGSSKVAVVKYHLQLQP